MFQRTAVRGRHVRDGGATAVEYALILGGVVLAAGLAVIGLRSVMSGALLGASNDQAILSDGSTATPPGGTGGPAPTGSTAAPSASTATPVPTTPTPTLTTATPAPTTPTAVPTTATPTPTTPTPTPTTPTPTPTPTPTQPAGSTAIVPGALNPVQIDINPNVNFGYQLTTCTFSPALKPATAQFTYNDITQTQFGTTTSITMTFSAPATATHGQAITATCTFSSGGFNPSTTTRTYSLWIS